MSGLQDRKRWEPAEREAVIFARWLASGMFHPAPEGTADENFSIAVPPPNVTGALHMGHALNGSVQDALIRYHRMRGRRVKWTMGTDHAGIATQTQVERLLRSQGSSREALGRAAFIERVWRWREEYGGVIFKQFQRLGASLDYEEERFTLDPGYVRAVMKVFVDLHAKGLIYRDNRMVNWDPGSHSAISDLEVEDREVSDTLYHVDYPLASGHGSVTVATVRPETMLADTAIAVHPDDERYTRLVGETAILPIVGRRLPIIADPYVKPEFGTGALKITPGHDPNDFEIGRAHGLEVITVIGEDGRMTEDAGAAFAGLPVLDARARVVDALRAEGSVARTEPYTHAVPFSHRSGERIEPLISLQWFMAMEDLAAPAIAAVEEGRLRVHPDSQRRRYLDWLGAIRPWCISRQLWWGHQIPVWYRGEETYVGEEPPAGEGWERDPDVLDTWFSSALWPFATLGWPDETPELRAFYPTDVLSTGRDILFLWVARMVMLGLEFTGELPFTDVYNHSTILAADGRRMSKSLGTGIDPLDLIDRHGADGTRFGLLAMSSTQDVRFSEEKIAQGAQLANKLFNASRLVLLRLPEPQATVTRPQRRGDAALDAPRRGRRGPLDPVAPAAREGRDGAGDRGVRVPPRRARPVRLRLRRAVRLVPGARQAAPVRGRRRRRRALRARRAGRDARARPSGDPVRDRGDLVLRAGRGRPADGGPLPARRPGARRRGGRGRARPRDRGGAGAARVARPRRRRARCRPAGAAGGRRVRADGRARRPAGAAGLVAGRRRSGGDRGRARRQRGRAPVRRRRPRRGGAPRRRAPRVAGGRDRARGAQAGQRRLHHQGARGGGGRRARQAPAPARGARGAVTWTAAQAEEHLLGLELFGMRFGLERMRRVLTALGSPQERFAAIHVVGTNGKSSTVRMTAALLEAHGVRTGAFLSPHLTSFAERIRIGDSDLEPAAFGAAVQRAAAAAAKVDRGLPEGERVTQFELICGAAFDELARRDVEVAVVEAGLGGRHDATATLHAPVVVLTNVGLEHTRWLGPTVTDIAREKLAVVGAEATLVLGAVDAEVEALAVATGARIVGPDPPPARCPGFQRANFAAALRGGPRAARRPRPRAGGGRRRAHHRAREAAGRGRAPAAHPRRRAQPQRRRGAGRRAARAAVRRRGLDPRRQGRRSDAARPARALRHVRLHGRANPRALPPATLASLAEQLGATAEIVPAPRAAVARAEALAGPDGAVVATGSIYLVADLLSPPGARRASAL